MPGFRLLIIVVPVLCGAAVARADDWPEFRGPTGQGHVLQGPLPLERSATRNVVWKQRIPGLGWSSPIIHDGRIFLTTAVPVPGASRCNVTSWRGSRFGLQASGARQPSAQCP